MADAADDDTGISMLVILVRASTPPKSHTYVALGVVEGNVSIDAAVVPVTVINLVLMGRSTSKFILA